MKAAVVSKILISLACVALLSACGGASNSEQRARSATGTGLTGSGSPTMAQKCSNGTSAVGYVYDGGTGGGSFKDRVGGLISASIDPSQFGEISGAEAGTTGLDLLLTLKKDENGQFVAAQSAMELAIFDSLVGTTGADGKMILPYKIVMSTAAQVQGSVNARQFSITFTDSYGSVTLAGQWNATVASGTISYQNTRHFASGTPASGTLGSFVVPTCALFQ